MPIFGIISSQNKGLCPFPLQKKEPCWEIACEVTCAHAKPAFFRERWEHQRNSWLLADHLQERGPAVGDDPTERWAHPQPHPGYTGRVQGEGPHGINHSSVSFLSPINGGEIKNYSFGLVCLSVGLSCLDGQYQIPTWSFIDGSDFKGKFGHYSYNITC